MERAFPSDWRQSGVNLASAATDLGIETSAGRGRCRHTSGRALAKAGGGRREPTDLGMMNSKAHKVTMTGFQPVQAYGHTARCFHFAGQGDVQEFENWHNNEQDPCMRNLHGSLVFRNQPCASICPQGRANQRVDHDVARHQKTIQNAGSVNFKGKLCKSCQTISVAGAKQRD